MTTAQWMQYFREYQEMWERVRLEGLSAEELQKVLEGVVIEPQEAPHGRPHFVASRVPDTLREMVEGVRGK